MKILNRQIHDSLIKLAPQIAFSVEYNIDPNFQWDGDGPDPRDDGYDPYDVDVFARAIVDGQTVAGQNSLGGTYEKPGEWDKDIGGYLPQMLDEAIDDLLQNNHSLPKNIIAQASKVQKYLKDYMHRSYEKQTRKRQQA